MLATAGPLPQGPGWAYEVKWDGVRAVAVVREGVASLATRTGTDITGRYPELAVLGQSAGDHEVVLDGEVVAVDDQGRPSFQLLQRRMHVADPAAQALLARSVPVALMLFDVMWLDGTDLRERPYDERRAVLEGLGVTSAHVHLPPAERSDPQALVELCLARGLEGVVAKRLASPYRSGRRSTDWIKHKLVAEQELLVVGWTPGQRARESSFGALLLGVHEHPGGPLRYAGRVGSGFGDAELRRWTAQLRAHERSTAPLSSPWLPRDARWVEPVFVVQVRFTEWTHEGLVRQASYLGERDDVDPSTVVAEPRR